MSRHFQRTSCPTLHFSFSINRLSTWVRMHLQWETPWPQRMVNVQTVVVIVLHGFSIVMERGMADSRPSEESSHLKWHVWFIDVSVPSRICICSHRKASSFFPNKSPFISYIKGNYTFLPLFMPECAVPLMFLSTWVTIYSHTSVGDCALLQEDWFYSISAGFSISTGWYHNTASLHVPSPLLCAAFWKSTSDVYSIRKRGPFTVLQERSSAVNQ